MTDLTPEEIDDLTAVGGDLFGRFFESIQDPGTIYVELTELEIVYGKQQAIIAVSLFSRNIFFNNQNMLMAAASNHLDSFTQLIDVIHQTSNEETVVERTQLFQQTDADNYSILTVMLVLVLDEIHEQIRAHALEHDKTHAQALASLGIDIRRSVNNLDDALTFLLDILAKQSSADNNIIQGLLTGRIDIINNNEPISINLLTAAVFFYPGSLARLVRAIKEHVKAEPELLVSLVSETLELIALYEYDLMRITSTDGWPQLIQTVGESIEQLLTDCMKEKNPQTFQSRINQLFNYSVLTIGRGGFCKAYIKATMNQQDSSCYLDIALDFQTRPQTKISAIFERLEKTKFCKFYIEAAKNSQDSSDHLKAALDTSTAIGQYFHQHRRPSLAFFGQPTRSVSKLKQALRSCEQQQARDHSLTK